MKFIFGSEWDTPGLGAFKRRVRSGLKKKETSIPKWCNEVHVSYYDIDADPEKTGITAEWLDEENAQAEITVHTAYRFAELKISSRCKDATQDELNEILGHEFVHIHTMDVVRFTVSIIENYVKNEQTRDFLLGELHEKHEALTQDIALLITEKEKRH